MEEEPSCRWWEIRKNGTVHIGHFMILWPMIKTGVNILYIL